MMNVFRSILLLMLFSTSVYAVTDKYPFKDPLHATRFSQLTSEIRCLVCQNQSIAESTASLALDMKNDVYVKIRTGLTDQQIKQALQKRYGDYVLFKPRFSTRTIILWIAPIGFLLLGMVMVFVRLRRNTHVANDELIAPEKKGDSL